MNDEWGIKHRALVIERISTPGRPYEFRAMVDYYGRETDTQDLLHVRHLAYRTLPCCSLISGKNRQSPIQSDIAQSAIANPRDVRLNLF